MTSFTEILYEVSERIATVTLHRPEKPSEWLKSAHAFELAGDKDLAKYARELAREKPASSGSTLTKAPSMSNTGRPN